MMTDWKSDCKVSSVIPESRGGQHAGSYNYPIRVEHIPTGTIAIVGRHSSQRRNRDAAMAMIAWELAL